MGVGEQEAVTEAIRAPYTAWARRARESPTLEQLDTSGLSAGEDHLERLAEVLAHRAAEDATMRCVL